MSNEEEMVKCAARGCKEMVPKLDDYGVRVALCFHHKEIIGSPLKIRNSK